MTLPSRFLPILLLGTAIWSYSTVRAATISVPGDAPTITAAMAVAESGDIILVSCGTYREHGIQVKSGVSLWSAEMQPECVTIDAEGKGRCLELQGADETTRLAGLTLRGGNAAGDGVRGQGGAVYCEDSAAAITRCVFVGNQALEGGALASRGRRGPVLESCVFRDNEATEGGAIYWAAAQGRIERCILRRNHAVASGGGLAGRGGRLLVETSLLAANGAGVAGGAIAVDGTDLIVHGSVLKDNTGGLAGGALYARRCEPRLENCTLHRNSADGAGTVFGLSSSEPTIVACLITGSSGELLAAEDSRPTLQRTNIFVGSNSWPGPLATQRNYEGNLSIDPMYCAADRGDLHLRPESPCLASVRGVIGALGAGCGAQFPGDVVE